MDGLAKAHMALTALNSASIVLLGLYTYRNISAMKADMVKISEALKPAIEILNTMRDNNSKIPQILQALTILDQDLKMINERVNTTVSAMDYGELVYLINQAITDINQKAKIDVNPINVYPYPGNNIPYPRGGPPPLQQMQYPQHQSYPMGGIHRGGPAPPLHYSQQHPPQYPQYSQHYPPQSHQQQIPPSTAPPMTQQPRYPQHPSHPSQLYPQQSPESQYPQHRNPYQQPHHTQNQQPLPSTQSMGIPEQEDVVETGDEDGLSTDDILARARAARGRGNTTGGRRGR